MRIVLWAGDEPNQQALAHKINQDFSLVGMVLESRKSKPRYSVQKIGAKVIERLFLSRIADVWWTLQEHFVKLYPDYPDKPLIRVPAINSEETAAFTRSLSPDLIIVSGTGLIRKKLLSSAPKLGIINLHTGLSPYIKGGPNCTNWCIASGQYHLVGNTIMWIDEGIDSGNLVATECTPLDGQENLNMLHQKVMEHAHDLMLRALRAVKDGKAANVPQASIATGKTYFSRDWGLREQFRLFRNYPEFKKCLQSGDCMRLRHQEGIVTIPPE
jgi:methionyl-tRNA formyltransferase